MHHYIAAVLLLQCFAETIQSETTNEANIKKLTWREILPNKYCGYRNDDLEKRLEAIHRGRRSVDGDEDKIDNGHVTAIDSHPWQVAILNSTHKFCICGGSIISKYHVLSAAHCFLVQIKENIGNFIYVSTAPVSRTSRLVAVGSSRYNESDLVYNIQQLYIHAFFSFRHLRNDIALLKIDGEFVWTRFVHPICLPDEDESYRAGRDCGISGFGDVALNSQNFLGIIHSAIIQLSPDDECREMYKTVGNQFNPRGMVCASGTLGNAAFINVCQGDSGGPLQCKKKSGTQRVLLGITSFGYKCAIEGFPGVFTRVTKYLPWIRQRVEVSLRHEYGFRSNPPEDEDVGRPANVTLTV